MKLHIFTADHEDGYEFHHTVDVTFSTIQDLMFACADVTKNLHEVFDIELEVMTLQNRTMKIKEEEIKGVMLTSANLPFSCFAEGPLLDTDQAIVRAPGCPELLTSFEVPEC